jgi:hypothetical protein
VFNPWLLLPQLSRPAAAGIANELPCLLDADSVVLLVARMLVPDILYGIGWAAGKAMSSLKSHASKELEALKAELAALKQQEPAA